MAVEEFGRAVMRISVEDKELRSGLKRSEAVVTQSAGKMQNSLDKVHVSLDQAGTSAVSTGAVFSTFGSEMAVVGGTVAVVGGRVASLGAAFASLGKAAFGPIGIILALGAGLGLLISRFVSARNEAKEFTESLKTMGEEAASLARITGKEIGTIADRITALGATTPAEAITVAGTIALRGLDRRAADVRRQLRLTLREQAKLQEEINKISNLGERRRATRQAERTGQAEFDILRDKLQAIAALRIAESESAARKLAQLAEVQRREAAAKEEQARREKELKEKEHKARMLDIQQKAVAAFQRTALGQVAFGIAGMVQERRMRAQIENLLSNPLIAMARSLLGISAEEARAKFGIQGPPTAAAVAPMPGPAGGSLPLAGFIRSGRAAGDAGMASMAATKERRENKQATDIQKIEKHLGFVAAWILKLSIPSFGAGP